MIDKSASSENNKKMDQNFYEYGSFVCLDGPAKKRGLKPSQVKVCFVSRDQNLLKEILATLATQDDCYWVKYSKTPKDGMFLGRCFFTTSEKAGKIWAEFKPHPKIMTNLQDDNFASKFRPT